MKNLKSKIIFITMIMMMFGMVYQTAWRTNITRATTLNDTQIAETSQGSETSTEDEFSELLSSYESEAPEIESAELSSVFTSEKEIEVYLKTNRSDIKKVVISGWSGGVYKKYLTSKTATYDEMRNIYTVTFSFNEIVNTKTNEVEALETAEYYFDACVYGNNGTMSYANLDKVQYTKTGIITTTTINENNETEIAVTAVEDGYVAVLSANEEVTENLAWQKVKAGETTTMAVPETDSETTNTQEVRVLYKSGTEVTEEDLSNGNVTENSIMLLSDENTTEGSDGENISPESTSNYKDNDLFTFEFSENSGKNDWVSYEDTPNVLESRIQGMGNTTATATIKIHTTYPGILSFDYMVSSESTFDEFYFELEGAERTTEVEDNIFKYIWLEGKYAKSSGQKGWTSFAQSFAQPRKGVITLKLTYTKDSNINRNDDKAAIRNLKFTSLLPTNGEVIINNNSEFTNSTNLNLALSVDGASYVLISEDDVRPTATDSRWETLTATKSYTLKNTEDGEKTIYAWFKTETEAISLRAAKDTIKLDTVAPTNTAPTLESKAKEINVTLGQTDANELLIVKYGYRVAGTTGEYTWTDNIRINDLIDTTKYTISGLTEMTEYEIVTKVSDGASTEIQSNSTKIKTKIVSDGIVVTKSPATATTGEVTVTIAWNDTTYTHEYSLDNGATWTQDSNENTTIVVTENKTILYRMKNATYDTGDLECVVDNIDKTGPQVSKVQIVSPETGTYGIDDVITIQLTWDEEVTIVTAPTLNIKFGDGNTVAVTATEQTTTTITYKYTIVGSDAGYLEMDSLTGGLVKDSLNHEANYELPKATGSRIFVENVAYNVTTNEYFGSLQRAIKAAGTNNVTIKLVGNNELKDTVVINQGQNIKLDLNGKTISYESLENIVTAIENSGTLEIYDSTAEKAGKIVATSQAKTVSTIVNNTTGNLIIKDITIESVSNTNSVSLESYAVYNKGAGIVTLGANDSEISTTKPELKATAKNSYGLYIANAEGSINYYDGIIKGTKNATYVASGVAAYTLPAGYAEKKDTSKENNINYEIAYLSNEASVELTMNGITTGYKSILEALAKVPKDGRLGKIKMMTDEELEDIAKIYKGQNVEIDLNGHILTRTEKVDGSVYAVINNGTLKISDTSAVQTGEIKAISTEDVVTYAVYNYTDGDLTIEGGKLFASIDVVSKTNVAYGLENVSNNNIKMSGGEIYREGYFINPGKFETPNNLYLNQRYETIDEKEYKINYISSNPVIEMNVNGGTTYYSGIHQAMNSVPTDGSLATIKFLQNEEVLDTVEILKGQNVEIDLNGKELLAYNIDTLISNAGDLKISDMSNTKQGKLVLMLSDLSIEDSRRYVIYNKGTGNVEVNEIAIQNNSKDNPWNNEFYGIYNISKGNVIVNEGEIIINAFGGDNNYYYGIYNKNNGNI